MRYWNGCAQMQGFSQRTLRKPLYVQDHWEIPWLQRTPVVDLDDSVGGWVRPRQTQTQPVSIRGALKICRQILEENPTVVITGDTTSCCNDGHHCKEEL